MRIVHISAQETGGAGRAARRLHEGLRQLGHDSVFFVRDFTGPGDAVVPFDSRAKLFRRAIRKVRRDRIEADFEVYRGNRTYRQESFSDDRGELGADLRLQMPPADVVNLHWVAGFIDYTDFLSHVPTTTPVVWTLHDMNPFTGGCHYDRDCGKYTGTCGCCPELGSDQENDLSRRIWHRKSRALRAVPHGRLQLVADSRWLASRARESSLFQHFPVSTIHYSLDVETFTPRDRTASRAVLGISADATAVLFVADYPHIERKGFDTLAEALARLSRNRRLTLLSMGRSTPELPKQIPVLHLGYVIDGRFQSIVYSAADVFVIPSLQEAFGQTALESMACGTPVVGSNTGGIPEVVREGTTGLLFPPGDDVSLEKAMAGLLDDPGRRAAMSRECRRVAVQEYSLEVQARSYVSLYQQMVGHNTKRALS